MIISGSIDEVRIWDVEKGVCVRSFNENGCGYVYSICQISSKLIACAFDSGKINIYNFMEGKLVRVLEGHNERCICLKFLSPHILSSGEGKIMKFWTCHSSRYAKMIVLEHAFSTFDVYPDLLPKNQILCGGTNGLVGVMDIERKGRFVSTTKNFTNKMIWSLNARRDEKLSADQIMVFTCHENTVRIWSYDLKSPRFFSIGTIECEERIFTSCLISDDIIATGGYKDTVELFSLSVGEKNLDCKSICSYCYHDGDIERLIFLPSPFFLLLSASADGKIVAFDPFNKELVKEFEGHKDSVESLLYIDIDKVKNDLSLEERINFLFQSENGLSKLINNDFRKEGSIISVSARNSNDDNEIIIPLFKSFLSPMTQKFLEKVEHVDLRYEAEKSVGKYEYAKEFFDTTTKRPYDWFLVKCHFGFLTTETMFSRKRDLEQVVDLFRTLKKLRMTDRMYVICNEVQKGYLDDEKLILLFSLSLVKLESYHASTSTKSTTTSSIKFKSSLSLVCFKLLKARISEILLNEKLRSFLDQLNCLNLLKNKTSEGDFKNHQDFSMLEEEERNETFGTRLEHLFETKKFSNISVFSSKEEESSLSCQAHLEVLLLRSNFFFQVLKFPGSERKLFMEVRKIRVDLSYRCISSYLEFIYRKRIDLSNINNNDNNDNEYHEKLKIMFRLLRFADMYFEVDLKEYLLKEAIPLIFGQMKKKNILEIGILRCGYLLLKVSEKVRECIFMGSNWEKKYGIKVEVFKQMMMESVRVREKERRIKDLEKTVRKLKKKK